MRRLDGIIDSVDTSLSKLQETVKDGSLTCCSPWGRQELDATELRNKNIVLFSAKLCNVIIALVKGWWENLNWKKTTFTYK